MTIRLRITFHKQVSTLSPGIGAKCLALVQLLMVNGRFTKLDHIWSLEEPGSPVYILLSGRARAAVGMKNWETHASSSLGAHATCGNSYCRSQQHISLSASLSLTQEHVPARSSRKRGVQNNYHNLPMYRHV